MKKSILKSIFIIGLLMFLATPALAQTTDFLGIRVVDQEVNLTRENPKDITGKAIGIVLSFLGLIAVSVILVGGFKWMLSGGNEEKVRGAKKLLLAGLIGLLIVIFSWAITQLVFRTGTDLIVGETGD